MSINRPEGLSPGLGSLMSPYLPESTTLRWKHRGVNAQTGATIRIKDEEGTLIQTFTTGPSQFLGPQVFGSLMENGNTYRWDVQTRSGSLISEWSEEQEFTFDSIETKSMLTWTRDPEKDEQVLNDEVFTELKESLASLATDYIGRGVEDELGYIDLAETLFTGLVVPSRDDFTKLKQILNWLAQNKEGMSPFRLLGLIENGLGASDIFRIRAFIEAVQAQPPEPPTNVIIETNVPPMYNISSLTGISDGVGDKDVTVRWEVEDYIESKGTIRVPAPSRSEDIAYYNLIFRYGSEAETIEHNLFYQADDITRGIDFSTNWQRLFNTTTIRQAKHSVLIRAVDKRGNSSNFSSWVKVHSGNVPLGLAGIELQWNKEVETAWPWVATSTPLKGSSYNHYIGNQNFKMRYRARTVDVTGLKGNWVTSPDVNFRGLLPPGPPRNPKWTSTHNRTSVSWDAGLYADGYDIRIRTGATGAWSAWLSKSASNRTHENTGRAADTEYHYQIRSKNALGVSSAILVKTRTKKPPEETVTFVASRNGQSWRTDYKSYYSMVKGGWRTDTTDVIQGRWEYIENTWDDWDLNGKKDNWVLKGMHNGNHRGLWFFNHTQIGNALRGKRLKSAFIYVRRRPTEHGWPKDATPIHLWTHNYSSPPSGTPMLGSYINTRVKLDRGEAAWVPVPIAFVSRIINGTARGLAVFKENVGPQYDLSYQRFESQASLRVTYFND